MTLFHDNGHLNDAAFQTLLSDQPLSELERLEIAEHLSFCDRCVERYALLLDDTLLLSPPEPITPSVLLRVKERARKIFLNKYTTVVAAASFAILFWNIGVFHIDVSGNGRMLSMLNDSGITFSIKAEELTNTVQQLLQHINFERGSDHNEKK